MSTDIDVGGGNEEDGVAVVACTLAVLGNIWECPMLRKFITQTVVGKSLLGGAVGGV